MQCSISVSKAPRRAAPRGVRKRPRATAAETAETAEIAEIAALLTELPVPPVPHPDWMLCSMTPAPPDAPRDADVWAGLAPLGAETLDHAPERPAAPEPAPEPSEPARRFVAGSGLMRAPAPRAPRFLARPLEGPLAGVKVLTDARVHLFKCGSACEIVEVEVLDGEYVLCATCRARVAG